MIAFSVHDGTDVDEKMGNATHILWAAFAGSAVTAFLGYVGARVYIHLRDRSAV